MPLAITANLAGLLLYPPRRKTWLKKRIFILKVILRPGSCRSRTRAKGSGPGYSNPISNTLMKNLSKPNARQVQHLQHQPEDLYNSQVSIFFIQLGLILHAQH